MNIRKYQSETLLHLTKIIITINFHESKYNQNNIDIL